MSKRELAFIGILLSIVISAFAVTEYGYRTGIITTNEKTINYIAKIIDHGTNIRLFYVIIIPVIGIIFPSLKSEEKKIPNITTSFVSGLILIVGYTGIDWYNLYVIPLVFAIYTITAVQLYSIFVGKNMKDEQSIFGLSNESSEFFFEFEDSDNKTLRIHKPQQNIYIDGGPGSGKSETWIKGFIYQCAKRNYAGFIYDWEGDPKKKGSPILSRVAYGSIEYFRKKNKPVPQFAFINFVDMSRTVRVNVLSEKYIPKDNEALFIRNIATTLMKNLESSWKEKTDFWANNAINYVYSIAYKCYKDRKEGIGTLAHVIAFALSDSDLVFRWLSEDPEIALNMSSMLTAWRLGAQQQTAGVVSSAQTPLVLLNNKYIFWVLSPTPKEEFSLDITNPEHPTLLCIGNSPSNKEAVSPPISCIASVIMSQMNNPGKVKSVFMVDEFPTIILQGIDTFIGTARKHYVATILAVQDFNQAIRDYGEKSANILKSSCGNQAYGMTGNDKTARDIESLLGERKEVHESISHNQETGTGSTTESLQREKVIRAREIAGQPIGHFTGKIAGGMPPFFSAQFKQSEYIEQEIPPFSKPVKIDGKPELENEILEEIVSQNYFKVIETVTCVLNRYSPQKRSPEETE